MQWHSLTVAQLSEIFAAADCAPRPGDFPKGLPVASGILPRALAEPSGQLDPALRQMAETISTPDVSLYIERAGSSPGDRAEYFILRVRGAHRVALIEAAEDIWRAADLSGHGEAMRLLEQLLEPVATAAIDSMNARAARDVLKAGAADSSTMCAICGTIYDDSPRFCRECGGSLAKADNVPF